MTLDQQGLTKLWEDHLRYEFKAPDPAATVATMVEDAHVNHVPTMTGGTGKTALLDFYTRHFIPKMPPDLEMIPVSRTIGTDRLVDEMLIR